MSRSHAMVALAGAVLMSSAASASDAYRPLPPVSGTLHAGRHGMYGDRGLGPVRAEGPAIYAVRRGAPRRMGARRFAYGTGRAFDRADAGPADYAGQGFVPESAAFGSGPVGYDREPRSYGAGYGPGGGLGVYTAGAYGPGPRLIAVPDHYNMGRAAGVVVHHGCGCAPSGLFGSFGGFGAY